MKDSDKSIEMAGGAEKSWPGSSLDSKCIIRCNFVASVSGAMEPLIHVSDKMC